MKNYYNTAIFASALLVIFIALLSMLGIQYHNETVKNDILRQKVDSLSIEVINLNVSLDESTNISISLADRLSRLYEIDKEAHRKLFSETD